MIVCICNQLRDKDIEQAIERGAQTPKQIFADCGVGIGCGCCCSHMSHMIEEKQQTMPQMYAMAQPA